MEAGEVLLKIRNRGYWRVVVRPSQFVPTQLSALREVEESLKSSVVQIRGWDYPHWPRDPVSRMGDHVEGVTDWEDHKEVWRAYTSGQFAHTFAMREDWLVDNSGMRRINLTPGSVLSYESTIYTLAEIFLFASRWALSTKLPGTLCVECDLFGLKNRQLQTLDTGKVPFDEFRRAKIPSWHERTELEIDALTADPVLPGLRAAVRLFEQFAWDTTEGRLREVLERLERFRAL